MEANHAAIGVRLTPLFEACWSYSEFTKLMPFGPDSEGQAIGVGTDSSTVVGEQLTGTYRLVQYPRWRADGLYLPDLRGLIGTESGDQVIVRAAGYAIPPPDAPGHLALTHWMRFWTSAPALSQLNETLAVGVGAWTGDESRVSYFAVEPTTESVSEPVSDRPEGAPSLSLLGTASWDYPHYEAVRVFGDTEGIGFAASSGRVAGGLLEGAWRGWHYPTYLRNGLYQIDAHAVIDGPRGPIVSRHAGLAMRPPDLTDDVAYRIVQHATFVTEAPELAALNRTLAIGVGYVHEPGLVDVSYYAVTSSPD